MRYVMARYRETQRELAYRFYVTDALRSISQNTANFSGGLYPQARFADIVQPKPVDDRTSEEVISRIRRKLRELR